MDTVVPLLSSIFSLVFALLMLGQYMARRRPYQLVWGIGLLMYFAATLSEFLVGYIGLKAAFYRGWYLFGAIYVAAYLGMGSLYLLAPRRIAHGVMGLLLIVSLYALIRVLSVPVDLSKLVEGEVLWGIAFPTSVRLLTPFFNIFGTIALVGGAAYSAWVFWRQHIFPHRVISNTLIAIGAILPALRGTFSRLGMPQTLYLLELAGIVIIFVGFLRSYEVFAVPVRRLIART